MPKLVLLLLAAGCVLVCWSMKVGAGPLEPENSPAPTMHTLTQVYDKIKQLVPESWSMTPSHSQVAGSYLIHMTAVGENQGNIEGSCEASGKEDTIVVVGNEHRVYLPTDPQTGLPTGQRRHEPYTILKYIDKATVPFYQAMCQGEHMAQVEIKFYRINPVGQEEHYYTVKLTDAIITEIRTITPNLESVSFVYNRIDWKWEPDNIEAYDTWTSHP